MTTAINIGSLACRSYRDCTNLPSTSSTAGRFRDDVHPSLVVPINFVLVRPCGFRIQAAHPGHLLVVPIRPLLGPRSTRLAGRQ